MQFQRDSSQEMKYRTDKDYLLLVLTKSSLMGRLVHVQHAVIMLILHRQLVSA